MGRAAAPLIVHTKAADKNTLTMRNPKAWQNMLASKSFDEIVYLPVIQVSHVFCHYGCMDRWSHVNITRTTSLRLEKEYWISRILGAFWCLCMPCLPSTIFLGFPWFQGLSGWRTSKFSTSDSDFSTSDSNWSDYIVRGPNPPMNLTVVHVLFCYVSTICFGFGCLGVFLPCELTTCHSLLAKQIMEYFLHSWTEGRM